MSGTNIAYHLRPNKVVDRTLFIELLSKLGRTSINVSDYTYIGFGGPFMEDFRALHTSLRISQMVCIERSRSVQERQKFNATLSCVEYELGTSTSYIDAFHAAQPTIAWLDFTTPGEIKQQLDDTRNLVSKLAHGDVFKVTLNASAEALKSRERENDAELFLIRKHRFDARAEEYAPADSVPSDFNQERFPKLLLKALRLAALRGVAHSGLHMQPLTAFTYTDQTPMLTATGILLDPAQTTATDFLAESRLEHWPFHQIDWAAPQKIDLPVLSAKERHLLERYQPNADSGQVLADLGEMIGNESISPSAVQSFLKFYRVYPEFVRVGAAF